MVGSSRTSRSAPPGEAAGEEHAASLPAREVLAGPVDLVGHPDELEGLHDERGLPLRVDGPRWPVRDAAHRDHLADEQVLGRPVLLRHVGDAGGALPWGEGAQVDPVDRDAPGGGRAQPDEGPDEGGLAAAVAPHEGEHRPAGDVEVDTADDRVTPDGGSRAAAGQVAHPSPPE
uniref:Uncharacterized protein n=1 Tax=Janibacter limosus TaxID=53458 RepID=A0AC61U8M2_9MICO|nr:hypothetical protein [Janibacter limosus]